MKKVLFLSALALTIALIGNPVSAGKPFEGVITYKITYPDNKASESQMAMYPKLLTVSIKGNKSRTDLQMNQMSSVEISDHADKSSVTLINAMGQKYAIKKSWSEIEKEISEEGTVTIEPSAETKVIAGYTCKKVNATVTKNGTKTTFEAWYSSEIGSKMANFSSPVYKDVDGALLEFTMRNRDITMKFTATSVEKKSLDAKDFEVPSDYTVTTEAELRSKFGGGND